MYRLLVIPCFALLLAFPAHAGPSDAREVARINNCQPKKIEVVQHLLGSQGKDIYQVTCNLPKTTAENPSGPDAVYIGCEQSLCKFMRAVSAEAK